LAYILEVLVTRLSSALLHNYYLVATVVEPQTEFDLSNNSANFYAPYHASD